MSRSCVGPFAGSTAGSFDLNLPGPTPTSEMSSERWRLTGYQAFPSVEHNSRGEPAKMGRRLSPQEITVRGLMPEGLRKSNSYLLY